MHCLNYIKSQAFLGITLASLALNACAPQRPESTTPIAPVSPAERAQILFRLRHGQPIPAPSFAPQPQPVPTQTSATQPLANDCAQFRATLSADLTQGILTVPEDWSQPRGPQIHVFYYARLLRDAHGNVQHPVVFFNGGPASDSHSSYDLIEHRSSAQTLSMIYLDQRGTGCSDPYPAGPLTLATARRYALYGSRAIVRDAEAVRIHLLGAATSWSIFGQSFGGEIVHRYVELAPQALIGAFAHGSTLVSDPITKIAGRLSSQLRVSQDYFGVYPDDAARLKAIRAAIAPSQCFDDGTSRVCGPVVVDAVTILLGFRTEWDSMHQWLGSLLGPDNHLDPSALGEFVRTFVFGVYAAGGFAASVLSYQEVSPGYSDMTACSAASSRILATTHQDPSSWPINECRLLGAIRYPWEPILSQLGQGDPFSLDDVASQLAQRSNLKFFLYSGGEDVFFPAALFSEEVTRLGSRITYRNFPDSGHDGFYTEEQVWTDLNSI